MGRTLPLLATVLLGCGGSGGSLPTVAKARDWVVSVATEVGETVTVHAGTLSDAVLQLWRTLFPVRDGRVRVDPDDPLRGTLEGEYRHHLVVRDPQGTTTEIDLRLSDPRMVRRSLEATWEPCPSNFDSLRSPEAGP